MLYSQISIIVANMSFSANRENKILAKISAFTVKMIFETKFSGRAGEHYNFVVAFLKLLLYTFLVTFCRSLFS